MYGEVYKKLALRSCHDCYTTTSLDDLNDELLLEILCRLPRYVIALRFKTVSKRWCSLISDPSFATQGFLMHRKIDSYNACLTMTKQEEYNTINNTDNSPITPPPNSLQLLQSHNYSLQFLPNTSRVLSTYRDLFLCLAVVGELFISNPVTKQWLALPRFESYKKGVKHASLVCQEGRDFRVVVFQFVPYLTMWGLLHQNFKNFDVLIYLSETREWKNVEVRLPVRPYSEGCHRSKFSSVVINGMVCIRYLSCFGAFNPFDVTSDFHGPLIAIGLPLPEIDGILLESCGKLVALQPNLSLMFKSFRVRWPIYKLAFMLGNNADESLRWETVSCLQNQVNVEGSLSSQDWYNLSVVCVHPRKEHLVYFKTHSNRLVLFDTRLQSFSPVTSTSDNVRSIRKIDHSCWPTPIPGALSSRKSINDDDIQGL